MKVSFVFFNESLHKHAVETFHVFIPAYWHSKPGAFEILLSFFLFVFWYRDVGVDPCLKVIHAISNGSNFYNPRLRYSSRFCSWSLFVWIKLKTARDFSGIFLRQFDAKIWFRLLCKHSDLLQNWWRRCAECRMPGRRNERTVKHLQMFMIYYCTYNTWRKREEKFNWHSYTVMAFQSSPKVTFVFIFTSIREKVGVDALKSGFVHRSRRAFLRVKKCYRNNFFCR